MAMFPKVEWANDRKHFWYGHYYGCYVIEEETVYLVKPRWCTLLHELLHHFTRRLRLPEWALHIFDDLVDYTTKLERRKHDKQQTRLM